MKLKKNVEKEKIYLIIEFLHWNILQEFKCLIMLT